ncbi:hypothetical protein C8Q80DRAFT_1104475 [Daedaleopsis nitida]|nr:hypothetical protein C8Q80DRAFT_1104475 [Daedaleopsis nitida]
MRPFPSCGFQGRDQHVPTIRRARDGSRQEAGLRDSRRSYPEPKEALSEKHDGKISWMQCPSFIEVKAKAKDSPVRAPGKKMIEEGAKESLAQGFEYAHFILTERPCQHHVYAIFFCGNVYCVCLFDRCGVAITPLYGMKGDGLRNFVLVVLRMTREMTAVDLGFDPTVHFAPRSSEQTFYQDSHPEFIIETPNPMPGEAPQRWETFGKPIRASHSIIGRGTNVWRTYDLHTERPAILKIMWRTSRRSPEADVYASIRSHLKARGVTIPPHTSITSEISGDDVRFQGDLLSVTKQRFRGLPVDGVTGKPSNNSLKPAEVNQVEDRNLYRIAFSEFGKPLWKYKSTLEFVRVMYQVIKAHEILSKNDVLHRDISNGNILIRVHAELDGDKPSPDPRHPRNPKTGRFISKDAVTTEDTTTSHRKAAILEYDYAEEHAEGLLIDFEYASIGSETSNKAPSETSDGMSVCI